MNFALAFALSFGGKAHPPDPWIGSDKVKHFFATAFVQSVAYSGVRATGAGHRSSLVGAWTASGVVGIGRELHDGRTKGLFSFRDLAWDVAGATAATTLLNRTAR